MAERAVMLVHFLLLTSSEAGLFRFILNQLQPKLKW